MGMIEEKWANAWGADLAYVPRMSLQALFMAVWSEEIKVFWRWPWNQIGAPHKSIGRNTPRMRHRRRKGESPRIVLARIWIARKAERALLRILLTCSRQLS